MIGRLGTRHGRNRPFEKGHREPKRDQYLAWARGGRSMTTKRWNLPKGQTIDVVAPKGVVPC